MKCTTFTHTRHNTQTQVTQVTQVQLFLAHYHCSLVSGKIWELLISRVPGGGGEAHVTHCSTQYTTQTSEVGANNLRRWSRGAVWGACE